MNAPIKKWPVQDAKARFSEMLDQCIAEGPQLVTRRGEDAAVLVPAAEWKRLSENPKPTIKDLLMTDFARYDIPIPERRRGKRRRSSPTF